MKPREWPHPIVPSTQLFNIALEHTYVKGQQGQSALNEFRDIVRALHSASIEVPLDVVFNYSAELDRFRLVLSLRAINNCILDR